MKSAYFDTLFESARVPAPNAFAILTAHNPYGKTWDSASNEAADRRLVARLRELGAEPWRVVGYAPDRSHAEAGWGAQISLEVACSLGRDFEQDAIYWVDNDRLELIGLKTPGRETLGSWQARVQPFALPYFTLHLGSCPPNYRFNSADEARVRDLVLASFHNFTIQLARGCFLGGVEEVFLISIATQEVGKLLALADTLRREWRQKGVGLHTFGNYYRVTEASDLDLMQQVLQARQLCSGV